MNSPYGPLKSSRSGRLFQPVGQCTVLRELIHRTMGIDRLWRYTRGHGVRIGVVDSGCEIDHPDLAAQICGFCDFTGDRGISTDRLGHGTHVSGVIAAAGTALGIAPASRLFIARVAISKHTTPHHVAQGIDWCVEQGCQIVNVSLATYHPYPQLEQAIKQAVEKGVIIFAAAGNSSTARLSGQLFEYPGAWTGVTPVAATDYWGRLATFSNGNGRLCAPGVEVFSTFLHRSHALGTGTSTACAVITGWAALIYSYYAQEVGRLLSSVEIENILRIIIPQPSPDVEVSKFPKPYVVATTLGVN